MSHHHQRSEKIALLKAELRKLENEDAQSRITTSHQGNHFDPSLSQGFPNVQECRRHSTPRSAGLHLQTQTQTTASRNYDGPRPLKRSKTQAHDNRRASAAAVNMGRSSSSRSATASSSHHPFRGHGPITPPITHSSQPPPPLSTAPVLDFYTHDMQQVPRGEALLRQQYPQLSTVNEGVAGGLMDVSAFLESRGELVPPSPMSAISPRQYLSPEDAAYQYPPPTGLPSTCDSLTEAGTIETPMSRQNSNMFNDNVSLPGQMGMVRIESQGSHGLSRQDSHNYIMSNQLPLKRPSASQEDIFSGIGASMPHVMPSSAPATLLFQMERSDSTSPPQDTYLEYTDMERSSSDMSDSSNLSPEHPHWGPISMERSMSNTSIKSNQSLKLRAKQALSRQNINATKGPMLQPKPASIKTEAAPSSHHGGKSSSGGNKEKIARSKYERPKRPKVMCLQCTEYPEGFRGEHELRRHTEAKHKGRVRKWVCQDPAEAGLPSSVQAVNPLSQCKQCAAHKQYGAYYNAAAHLRRTHFKKKPARGAKKNGGGGGGHGGDDEKRGGKGGGDWPPMNELKNWMKEINVSVADPGVFGDDLMGDADGEYATDAAGMPIMMDTPAGFDAFAGVGCSFPDGSAGEHGYAGGFNGLPDFASHEQHHGGVDHAGYTMATGSASFSYPELTHAHGLSADGYPSPVESSTATVTQNMFAAEQGYDGTGIAAEEQLEMGFDLVFNGQGMTASC